MRDVAQHAGSLPVGVRVVESVPAPVGQTLSGTTGLTTAVIWLRIAGVPTELQTV